MKLYGIYCTDTNGWEEYDVLWGNESRVYDTREEADQHVAKMLADGDWTLLCGVYKPPVYEVREIDAERILLKWYLFDEGDGGIVEDLREVLELKGWYEYEQEPST